MKFLIHANAPHVRTGYGVQCAQLVEQLHDEGHDVAVSCTYGQQGGLGKWRPPNPRNPEKWPAGEMIALYPVGYEVNGNDVLHRHAQHFFDNDPTAGWIISLLDVWCLVNPLLADWQIAAWTPVDHFPAPQDVLRFFERSGAVPVPMSRFGERLLFDAGLDPTYVPLTVDTRHYTPTPTLVLNGTEVTGRQMLGIPEDAFVVGMVAMNKGWARDRKGFNEAFRAFGRFWNAHPDAVLYVHSDWPGAAEGLNLKELATHCAIPEHAIVFPDLYAYFPFGFTPEQMAAAYTAFDVLLAPSHGEGFCVPLIEAQACGTPVIVTDFSAQTELVGAGWMVGGQPEWDPAQHASYIVPYVAEIVLALEQSYERRADPGLAEKALATGQQYDAAKVFNDLWLPLIDKLCAKPDVLELDREPMPDEDAVAVIVPLMREDNLPRLTSSFEATNDGSARLHIVTDDQPTTYAQKVNRGFNETSEPWVLIVGDDVEFKPGWLTEARKMSERFDIIGTNDSSNGVKNPDVQAGRHADHFFVRRAYVDTYGGCLDGPGVLAPEAYRHWYTDREIIELAKARGVFTPCLASVVEHHHPGYEGREDLRQADPVYMKAVDSADDDQRTWMSRVPLIQQQRTSLGK